MPIAPFNFSAATPVPLSAGNPRDDSGRTLASMRIELTRALGNRDGEFQPHELNRWINDGYLEVTGMLDEPEFRGSTSFVVPQGSASFAFAGNDLLVHSLGYSEDDEYTQLVKITDTEAWRLIADLPDGINADPTHYFVRTEAAGTLLVLHPQPRRELVLTLDFSARPKPMTNDNDSPLLEEGLHRAVLEFAKSFAFGDLREYELAGQAQNRAVALVRTRLDRKAAQKVGVVGRARPIRHEHQLRQRHIP